MRQLMLVLVLIIQTAFVQLTSGKCLNNLTSKSSEQCYNDSITEYEGCFGYDGNFGDCNWTLPNFTEGDYVLVLKIKQMNMTSEYPRFCSGYLTLPGEGDNCRHFDTCYVYVGHSATCAVGKKFRNETLARRGYTHGTWRLFDNLPREIKSKCLHIETKAFKLCYEYIRCSTGNDATTAVVKNKESTTAAAEQSSITSPDATFVAVIIILCGLLVACLLVTMWMQIRHRKLLSHNSTSSIQYDARAQSSEPGPEEIVNVLYGQTSGGANKKVSGPYAEI